MPVMTNVLLNAPMNDKIASIFLPLFHERMFGVMTRACLSQIDRGACSLVYLARYESSSMMLSFGSEHWGVVVIFAISNWYS